MATTDCSSLNLEMTIALARWMADLLRESSAGKEASTTMQMPQSRRSVSITPIAGRKPAALGVVGTYTPRICGIATFTGDLVRAIQAAPAPASIEVVALRSPGEALDYPPEVMTQIRQELRQDYIAAAEALNRRNLDAVSLQHEFGIFGGPDGDLILELMRHTTAPIISTLHTVLHEPTATQRDVLREIAALSARVVVMSQTARRFLIDLYEIESSCIEVIPHGVPELPFADSDRAKRRLDLLGRPVILTFGLLSANKGIEDMISAMPAVVRELPDATYIILGAGHPLAVSDRGEPYVDSLKRLTREVGVEANVRFETRFAEPAELRLFLRAADVYVTPYIHEDQITSGTLAYALGSGIATVSTPYWHAKEMLADGRGRLVPFRDVAALSREVAALLSDDVAREETRRLAYEYSRGAVWPEVGRRYLDLIQRISPHQPITIEPLRAWGASVA